MAGTKKKSFDYATSGTGPNTTCAGRKTAPKGPKYPNSPHEKEGQFEKSVGAQTKLKRF